MSKTGKEAVLWDLWLTSRREGPDEGLLQGTGWERRGKLESQAVLDKSKRYLEEEEGGSIVGDGVNFSELHHFLTLAWIWRYIEWQHGLPRLSFTVLFFSEEREKSQCISLHLLKQGVSRHFPQLQTMSKEQGQQSREM